MLDSSHLHNTTSKPRQELISGAFLRKLNRDLQSRIAEMRRFAFEEQDAPVIEAQQQIIESATEPLDPVILTVDVGCVRYKRVLNNMLAAEQS